MDNKRILLITPKFQEENSKEDHPDCLKLKEYARKGYKIQVVYTNNEIETKTCYEIDEINVIKTGLKDLRQILMSKKYDIILVNSSDKQYAHVIETSYLKDTPVIYWNSEENRDIGFIANYIKQPKDIIKQFSKVAEKPILTIVIPSYNAENTLEKCLQSMLKSDYSYLTEILVINDGSKDRTAEIGKYYQELTTVDGRSIVKLIDKENGGHGSGINKGIELARGKYFKVVDSDDWLEEQPYNELLKKLIDEDCDLILTDLSEARSFEDKLAVLDYYENLETEKTYHFDDICVGENGFKEWGPMLPTATYKLDCLKRANFKLFEKTFYVDMIYNAYSIIYIDTVKKYDLNIYRYYIGNEGQSVSQDGMKKNYKNHEDVTIELMRIVVEENRLSDNKREYVLKRLCLPMVYVQYYINLDLFKSRKKFLTFEKRVKQYPELMKYSEFNKRVIRFHRYTNGIFIKMTPFIRKQLGRIRNLKNKIKKAIKK